MKTKNLQHLFFSSLLVGTFCSNVSAGYSLQNNLSGDWGGQRTRLSDGGFDIGISYTAEPAANVSGGYDETNTYLHNINAELKLDLDKLINIPKTSFLAKYSSRSGDNLSEEYVVPGNSGDGRYLYGEYYNKSQEAFGGQTTKLVNFQLSSQFTDQFSADYGRLVMNDLFLRSDLYCNFMNNAVCGSPKGVFTPYALSAYPDATVGVHIKYQANEMVDIKLGVFDGGWTEQDKHGWDWSMGHNGVALMGEFQLYFDRSKEAGTQRVIKFGMNHHTGDFSKFESGEITSGSTSWYLLSDWRLFQEADDANQGLGVFGSIVLNDDDEIAGLPVSFTLGGVYTGLIPSRNRDKLGLQVTVADHSDYNTYTHDFISGLERGTETIVELTYNLVLGLGIEVMPSVQYISHPNGSRDFDDVTILGTKFNVNL
jgi:porin